MFTIESSFDAMRPIGSIIVVTENLKGGNLPMKVDWEGDKILVLLAKKDFADYKPLKNSGAGEALATTLGLPALVEAIRLLETDDGQWCLVLTEKIHKNPLSITCK